MNRLLKQIVPYLIASIALILQSGCKTETDKMLSQGIEKFEKADFAGAAKIYSEIIRKDSLNIEAYFKLASANMCIHKNMKMFETDLSKAINVYKFVNKIPQIKNVNNDDGAFYQIIAETRNKIIRGANEISAFTEAIQKNPQNEVLYFGRGLWSFFINTKDGFKDFTTAIELYNNFTEAYLMRGRSYFFSVGSGSIPHNVSEGNYKAMFDFKRAFSIDPNNKETLYELARAYMMNLHHKVSIEYLTRLLSIDQGNENALSIRAFCMTIVGDYSGAVDDLNILVNRFPENLEYLKELGLQKIMAGKREDGLKDLRKARANCKEERLWDAIQVLIDKYSPGEKIKFLK